MYMFPQLGSGQTIHWYDMNLNKQKKTLFKLIDNNKKSVFSSTKKMLSTSNFLWEIWHYKIRVDDIDSAI